MRVVSRIRSGGLRLPVLFLGIGLCVFVWGLRYKLSLYDPPQSASHCIPSAKLLSRDELPETLEPIALRLNVGPAVVHLVLASVLFRAVPVVVPAPSRFGAAWRLALLPSRGHILERTGLQSFFFRPPPAVLHGLFGSR